MAKVTRGTVKQRTESKTAKPSLLTELQKPGQSTYARGLLFGPPKSGKTVGSFSGGGRKLGFMFEPDGDLSLRGREDIDIVKPTNFQETSDILRDLFNGEAEKWDWLVFDSVTFCFDLLGYRKIFRAVQENKDVRRPYGDAGAAVNQLIHDVTVLPMNVMFTAQVKALEADDDEPLDQDVGEFPITLNVTPMVYKALTPSVSFIGRTFKRALVDTKGNKSSRYLVSFDDFGKSPAGNRLGLPNEVEDLNLERLLQEAA